MSNQGDSKPIWRLCAAASRQVLYAALALSLLFATAHGAEGSPEKTKALIAILKSDGGLFEKARACQQLGEVGTSEAVPALAGLLGDEHLSAYARAGLEGISGPAAVQALREAVDRVKGPLLAGVVNSLGVLRDGQAVGTLRRLAFDPNSGVQKEALLALGNISTTESIQVLRPALGQASAAVREDAAAALLLAAQKQMAEGHAKIALGIYDAVRKARVSLVYRAGATRGAILARDSGRVSFLIQQLRSDEPVIRNVALLTIREIPDDSLAAALNGELKKAKPELQIQLLRALIDCHNQQSVQAAQAQASNQDPEVRRAALGALGRIGGRGGAQTLLNALADKRSAEEVSIATDGLKRIPGASVDDLIVQSLASASQPGLRVDLIRLLEARDATNSTGEILKQASGPDDGVSVAAFSALKSLAGPRELPRLMALTKATRSDGVREAAESAISTVCAKTSGDDSGAKTVLAELNQATSPAERNAWIRILITLGYKEALPAIRKALVDADEAVASNAVRNLGRWPDPTPIDDALGVVETNPSPRLRKYALSSVIDLAATAADQGQRPDSIIVTWLQRANRSLETVEDKRRVISILGRLKDVGSLRLLLPYLDEPGLRAEASLAVVQIAPALASTDAPPELRGALERIVATTQTPEVRDKAAQIIKTIPTGRASRSLFDGHSLDGWEGDPKVWRVRDGVIVGGSLEGNPRNEFLATVKGYTNFVLRLEYKLVGTEGFVNSGVQIRSVRVKDPPNEMSGYQADIGAGFSGSLYDESRRNKVLAHAVDEQIKRLEKPGDWSYYEVRCIGRRIQIVLNHEQTVDYTETDESIRQDGIIGLQIHGGNKAEVSFRAITIEELP